MENRLRSLAVMGATIALLTASFCAARAQSPAPVQQDSPWRPLTSAGAQDLPAVDGVNGKIEALGGGWHEDKDDRTKGFYGASGSLTVPLSYRWGAQFDGAIGSDNGAGDISGATHLFWRDPTIGLLGAYGSYTSASGLDFGDFGTLSMGAYHIAAEAQYYWGRWNFTAAAGIESVSFSALPAGWGDIAVSNRFFDTLTAAYYVTDNFQLWIGQRYVYGTNALALGFESAAPMGGGRMASFFSDAMVTEGGTTSVRAGLRLYFGQSDKTLIDRHRQDDPPSAVQAGGCGFGMHRSSNGPCRPNQPGPHATPAPDHPGCWRNAAGDLRCY